MSFDSDIDHEAENPNDLGTAKVAGDRRNTDENNHPLEYSYENHSINVKNFIRNFNQVATLVSSELKRGFQAEF